MRAILHRPGRRGIVEDLASVGLHIHLLQLGVAVLTGVNLVLPVVCRGLRAPLLAQKKRGGEAKLIAVSTLHRHLSLALAPTLTLTLTPRLLLSNRDAI